MKLFKNNPKKKDRQAIRIKKSKEIIKQEKLKIKEEKLKRKKIKQEKFYKSKFGKFIKKIFFIKEEKNYKQPTLKSQILSMIFFEITGAILCLLVLYALTGGKNYIKLYNELNKFIDTYDTITSEYYGQIDKQELIDDAISSMISATDDQYTNYTDESTTDEFLENVSGIYEGIGATVSMDESGNIVVIDLFEDSPASKAGLKINDIIIKINGEDYKGKTSNDMANYVKTSTKDKIKLTVLRDNEEKELTITRKKIEVPTTTSKVIEQDNKKIGYISISIFSAISTEQFEKELKKLEKDEIDALVIDVRNNTGGYLSTVTDITSLFLKKGQVIYQLEDEEKITKIKDETSTKRTYPIAVLTNIHSASASEILAAAIKESYKGHVVGTNTYGKGTVQKTKKLSDGSMIKYTIQKWLTPEGNWVGENGLVPTEYIELDLSNGKDNQLEKAISLLIEDLKK